MQIKRNLLFSEGGLMRKYFQSGLSRESMILIPGKKTVKAIILENGNARVYYQSKEKSERITDILLEENGKRHLLFRIENRELTFFLTSKCNQHCIMCPQKLDIDSPDNDLILQRVIDNLDYDVLDGICFTGGESILKMKFIEQVVKKAPERIFITILTNGTIMPNVEILKSPRVKLCVPLYASYDELHNKMTGVQSFYKVIENLIKISQYETLIELRFVMTSLNWQCLEEYARFVWRNLPFIQDVAFMGMELTAEALKNKDELWINPKEYIDALQKAVSYLDSCDVTAWIYNLPLCLFDEPYRKFVVKSISPWKVRYVTTCDKCKMKSDCGGMFFSDVKEVEKIIIPKQF